MAASVSVIIPVFNEAERLPHLLSVLCSEPAVKEVIVVDGDSTDESVLTAQSFDVIVLTSETGRGQQLRVGGEAATGDVLWFVHADTRVPDGAVAAILDCLEIVPDTLGGNFRLLFDGDDEFSRWLDGFYERIRARGFYYGDSGIFVRRTVYEYLGGIPPLALMEDYAFVRKLEATGLTVCINEPPLVTSSRRFHGRWKWAIVFQWLLLHGLFYLGVSDRVLVRLYDSMRLKRNP